MIKTIEETNRVDEVLHALDKLERGYINVGILGEEKSEIIMIATIQEFGLDIKVTDKMRGYLHSQGLHLKKDTKKISIPERSYIRASFDENKKKVIEVVNDLIIGVMELTITPDDFFKAVGNYCVGLIQAYMTTLQKPANHPLTVQKKGSSNPLIDSGRLRKAVEFEVKYR